MPNEFNFLVQSGKNQFLKITEKQPEFGRPTAGDSTASTDLKPGPSVFLKKTRNNYRFG